MSANIRLRSVSVIVNDNFATAKIFKAHHIDFCGGGLFFVSRHTAMSILQTYIIYDYQYFICDSKHIDALFFEIFLKSFYFICTDNLNV